MVHFSKTTDLNIASFLLCKGYELKELERLNDRQIRFVFNEDIEKAELDAYWANEPVGVLDFTKANKDLKQRLHIEIS